MSNSHIHPTMAAVLAGIAPSFNRVPVAHPVKVLQRGGGMDNANDDIYGPWVCCKPNYSAPGIAYTIYPEATSEPLAEVLSRPGAERIAQVMADAPSVLQRLDALMERCREDAHSPTYQDLLDVRGCHG